MADERDDIGAGTSEGAGDAAVKAAAERTEAGSGDDGQATREQESWQEERARLLRENEELRQSQGGRGSRREESTDGADDPEQAAIQQRLKETQRQLANPEILRLVAQGDPLAIAHVESLQATANDLRMMAARIEIADYVSELPQEHRKPFRGFLKQNGNRFADLDAAFDAYEAKLLRGQRETTTKAAERAKAIAEAHDEGRVGTAVRGVTAEENRARVMTEAEFDARVEKLENEGRFGEARAERQKLRVGQIVFK